MARPREIKDSDILELWNEGCMDIEIAEILGRSYQGIRMHRIELGLERNPTKRRNQKRFSIYHRDSSSFIFEGTIKEISAHTGLAEQTLRCYMCRQKNGERPHYELFEVEE